MKASVQLLIGCVALGLSFPCARTQAAAPPLAGDWAAAVLAAGQTENTADARRQSDDLLKQANQALRAGKIDQAEALTAQAEKLGVKYDGLRDRWPFQNTPDKLRKQIAEQKAKAGKTTPRPSARFNPDSKPSVPNAGGSPVNGDREQAVEQLTDEAKSKAKAYAEQGRAAVARGDKPAAKAFYQKAIAHQAEFAAGEYSPASLAEDLKTLGIDPRELAPAETVPTSPYALNPNDVEAAGGDKLPSLSGPPTPLEASGAAPNPNSQAAEANPLSADNNRPAARPDSVQTAGGGDVQPKYPVAAGVYNPATDTTRNQPASSQTPAAAPAAAPAAPPGVGLKLYQEGVAALEKRDRALALQKFKEANRRVDELDVETRQALKDKLIALQAAAPQALPASDKPLSPLEQVNSQQELLRQKLAREIHAEEKAAQNLSKSDPKGAYASLKKLRERVAAAEVDAGGKKQLLMIVDRQVAVLASFIENNKATIENDERNKTVRAELDRGREVTLESQQKLAELVEKFNKLMDELRFPEAEVIAKTARELEPENPVVVNMTEKSQLARRVHESTIITAEKERGFVSALQNVEKSGIPMDDNEPWQFGDVKEWTELTKRRGKLLGDNRRLTPVEMEIQKALNKPVQVKFENQTLSSVLEALSQMTGVNIHADPSSLHSEGVTPDTPVSITLQNPVMLKSILDIILKEKHLSYVIRNEVLLITSEQTRDSNTYVKVYYVADLVVPIPNFVPNQAMSIPGALRESLNALGYGGSVSPFRSGPLTLAANEKDYQQPTMTNPTVLAQQLAPPGSPLQSSLRSAHTAPQNNIPVGAGGGVQADFDSLIDLITTTVSPQSWDEVGGPGSIERFATNLSLVVSQTQDVHEKIADLLAQLRRLQDLQVTIEVRFITLSDRFFESIGVDFNFNIRDKSNLQNAIDRLGTAQQSVTPELRQSATIGINQGNTPTTTLAMQFKQGSFSSSSPQFGGFDPNTAATFGFAILSDIEAFFFLRAAQGDERTNVLQAPKVTLFNGQQSFVQDFSSRPFVTSVIPVVGDFAAAHMPVITVLNEGTSLSVQAVISPDRRFVRLTLVPFFSQIGDVQTFTFNGTTTTDTGTSVKDPTNDKKTVSNGAVTTTSGTTVQLPTFATTSVNTTVSVPDGGTVLLGGIKRLRESRSERGVPFLSKIPYVSRLFRNIGIGRDAQTLMMMVTPRIIIQEEEENKLGINPEP